jgi:Flp pilus assembly protein protease CpaA
VTDRIDKAGLVVSVVLLLVVLELVRRKKLSEEFSFLWVGGALAVLGISLRRDLLDRTALWLGVYYPPSLLLLILLVVVFVGSLSFTVVLSRHRRQIERLMEDSAILTAEVRELRKKGPDPELSEPLRQSKS